MSEDLKVQAELEFYRKLNPEAAIFFRKKSLAARLLKISVKDLKNATEQPWYAEYLALAGIRLENPTLRFAAKKFALKLELWFKQNLNRDERELALLGMIQLIEPSELCVPFNQNLWPKKMVRDVQAVLLNQFVDENFWDEDIATYYLWRQNFLRHGKRKMRVAFMVNSYVSAEKILPVFEALKARGDVETFIVVYAGADLKYLQRAWDYFQEKYPDEKIYSYSLMDLRRLEPDYVFLANPYDERRNFPGFRTNDIAKFAKVCIISYGTTLSKIFSDRLFDEFRDFWHNVYFYFPSAESVKAEFLKRFPQGLNYRHVEFFGFPALKPYYMLEKKSSDKKVVMWSPRWNFDDKIGGSHFMDFKDEFIALANHNLKLIFRPHPDLFNELIHKKFMTREQLADFDATLKKNDIHRQTTLASMFDSIRAVDIFITDYSSIMSQLFLTGRPIIYCQYSKAVPLPEYEEMFSSLYVANTWSDVEKFLDDLLAGKDPLFERRQEIAKKIYDLHKDAAGKIAECLAQDFKLSEVI